MGDVRKKAREAVVAYFNDRKISKKNGQVITTKNVTIAFEAIGVLKASILLRTNVDEKVCYYLYHLSKKTKKASLTVLSPVATREESFE